MITVEPECCKCWLTEQERQRKGEGYIPATYFLGGNFYCYRHYIGRPVVGKGVRCNLRDGEITIYGEWLNPDGSIRHHF